ncbi:membrane alanyl aminopeptidase [Leptospira yanagawae serovar Saopaulo str. Sao Paulo = ATCC 700523]|uniref:Aminopeptidase N n=1 Tax=Leptospira yanagawae serovar Saopaulo str. Sao Paulo = ATCC 700523 TaxID=1249483 RepID=A0A5E8HG82_9LEPT|nr:aminopeptidase N [Leptospira yanagawae]EOQ89847.1 membrane alanyl aminopeptidase [Leptospira yanagawae serovar Saopaulo str. Sao Paulo = ATCC 700523]
MKQTLTALTIGFLILFQHCRLAKPTYHLTIQEAESRYETIENIKYNLEIQLTTKESFTGKVDIHFVGKRIRDLRLDYFQGVIKSIMMNDEVLSGFEYKNGHIQLPSDRMMIGNNKVSVVFETPYAKTGNGLHKFVDPDDKEIYLYSQFEAFHANKMFPCFDQPDLKATFQLQVKAPKNWKVISTTLTSSQSKTENPEEVLHQFPETKKISTYVFSLHAGPYQVWEDKFESIPLRLFVRKSLAKYVDPKDWFSFTKEGFTFFNSYFGIPYPFEKYDQIIVPEFNFGAMENVAAVTFSERFVSRSPMTRSQRENLSDVVLHEMAHMWFGNLVTMKWWNGLWLNESFATYMASLAQAKNSEFQETWISFFEKMKQWAYEEDSFSTNHPVEAKVNNTEEAFTQFDGITYGKGASVLKQLVFFIGEESFQKGVQNYLRKYSYSNSTLADFLKELEFVSGFSMKKWSKDWLETKGTNQIELTTICADNNLYGKIIQSAPGPENKFRDHKTNLGIYYFDKSNLSLRFEEFPVVYSGRSSEAIIPLTTCPDFAFINSNDHDFAIWKWTNTNKENLEYVLEHDKDPMRKLILWTDYFRQVTLANLTFDDFKNSAVRLYKTENDTKIKRWILSKLASDSGASYFTSRFWFPEGKRNEGIETLQSFLLDELTKAKAGSDEQRYLVLSLIDSTFTEPSQKRLYEILENKLSFPGFKVDQDIRWNMITKLSSLEKDRNKIQPIIDREKKLDPSSRGVNASLAAEAAEPNANVKEKWIHILLNPKASEYSTSTLRVVSYSLFPEYQRDIQLQFLDLYFNALDQFQHTDDENYLDAFAKSMAPDFCTDETLLILKKFTGNHPKLPAPVKKTLFKQIDLEGKCIQMKQKHKQIIGM